MTPEIQGLCFETAGEDERGIPDRRWCYSRCIIIIILVGAEDAVLNRWFVCWTQWLGGDSVSGCDGHEFLFSGWPTYLS